MPAGVDGKAVLSALGDAVVVSDRDGRITGWYGAAEKLFGYPAEEVLGRPVTMLFLDTPQRDDEELATLGGAGGVEVVVRARRRRGRALLAAVSVRALRAAGGEVDGAVVLFKPMGAWLDPRGAGRRVNPDWDRTLGGIVRELIDDEGGDLTALESTETMARVLSVQAARMLSGVQTLFSLVPDDRPRNFRIIAGTGPWAEGLVGREWARAGTVAGLAMELRRPIETVLLQERSNLRHTLEPGGIHTARLVPLWTAEPLPDGRDAIGVLGFYREERRYFTPYERRLIDEFCRLASLMLQRAELSAAAARTAARLQQAVDAARDLATALDTRAVLRALVAAARRLAAADRLTVIQVAGGQFEILAASDSGMLPGRRRAQPVSAVRAADGSPVLERAVSSRQPVVTAGHPVESLTQEITGPGGETVFVPVEVAGQPPLVLAMSRRGEPFSSEGIVMVQTIGNIAALALRNARLLAGMQEAGRVKTDFLNMAAHELRTPLTVIRGYLAMLSDGSFGAPPEGWEATLELLAAKCDDLGRLVDDLLLAARLETGRLVFRRTLVDLNAVATGAVGRALGEAGHLKADLRLEAHPRPVVVTGDPHFLGRILDGLLANALAFSPDRPWIRVRVGSVDGRGVVEVEDRGRGIEEQDKERVFERFARLSDAGGGERAGTGLGLYIGRALAERQGGRLRLAWSRPGEGSRFVIELPEAAGGAGG